MAHIKLFHPTIILRGFFLVICLALATTTLMVEVAEGKEPHSSSQSQLAEAPLQELSSHHQSQFPLPRYHRWANPFSAILAVMSQGNREINPCGRRPIRPFPGQVALVSIQKNYALQRKLSETHSIWGDLHLPLARGQSPSGTDADPA